MRNFTSCHIPRGERPDPFFLSNYQLSIAFLIRWGLGSPSPTHTRILSGLVLCRSCTDNHTWCELMHTTTISRTASSISRFSPTSTSSYTRLPPPFWKVPPSLGWWEVPIDDPSMAEHSALFIFSAEPWSVISLCVNYYPLQKEASQTKKWNQCKYVGVDINVEDAVLQHDGSAK